MHLLFFIAGLLAFKNIPFSITQMSNLLTNLSSLLLIWETLLAKRRIPLLLPYQIKLHKKFYITSKSELAKSLGVTRTRIIKITDLLGIPPSIKEIILSLGEYLNKSINYRKRSKETFKI